jgi:hypothetical protein
VSSSHFNWIPFPEGGEFEQTIFLKKEYEMVTV